MTQCRTGVPQLVVLGTCHAGELVRAFEACSLVFRHDVATTRFLLPYIVHNAVALGDEAARASVRAEVGPRILWHLLHALLSAAASSAPVEPCCRCMAARLACPAPFMHLCRVQLISCASVKTRKGC